MIGCCRRQCRYERGPRATAGHSGGHRENREICGRHVFEQDELVQIWTIHHLEIIGEATRSLSPELRTRHSGGPWAKIVGMRNVLAHRYFGIDPEAVWTVIDQDLPALKREVEAILREAEKA